MAKENFEQYSYVICEECGEKVRKNEEGKRICPVCRKEVRLGSPAGWGNS